MDDPGSATPEEHRRRVSPDPLVMSEVEKRACEREARRAVGTRGPIADGAVQHYLSHARYEETHPRPTGSHAARPHGTGVPRPRAGDPGGTGRPGAAAGVGGTGAAEEHGGSGRSWLAWLRPHRRSG